jgi:hypothetical protein
MIRASNMISKPTEIREMIMVRRLSSFDLIFIEYEFDPERLIKGNMNG